MLADIFSSVLMLSIMASAVICVIFITKFAFKEKLSAKWHYYIWFLLFIRLVIPFTPQYSLDIGELTKQTQTVLSEPGVKNEVELQNSPDIMGNTKASGIEQEAFDLSYNQSEYAQPGKVQEKFNTTSVGDFLRIAAIVWFWSLIVLLIYSLVINIIIGCRVKKTAIPCEQDRIITIVEDCKKSMKITKRIPVVYQSCVSAPALYGILRPVLLMTSDIANQLDEKELRYIVLHELCHYKRKDNATGLILMLLNMLHWFNPLMWLAVKKIKEDRELVCDQQALAYVGVNEKRNYARTIVKILELFSEKHFIQSASSIIQGRASNMEWRLKFIKTIKRKSAVLTIFVTAIVILGGVLTVNYINGSVKLPKTSYAVADEKENTALRGEILDRNGVKLVERTTEGSNYTYGNLASHVIGAVNQENKGIQGIEKLMDDEAMVSNNITLTIDKNIQHIVENVLEQAIKDNKVVDGAAAIVIDPTTGEVLAMCSKPDFDLNNLDSIPVGLSADSWAVMQDIEKVKFLTETVWRNKAISDTNEPGSVFKAITAAAGLEEGVITPNSMVDDHTVTVDGHKINCWKPNEHGVQTFRQSVYNSCNPPFVKIAQDLGIDKFYNYIDKFGFYDLTGIELSGESKSQIHKKPTEIDMAVASFGQRFHVTPIQILSAYGAIANGGNLVKPQIIKKVSDSKGNTIKEFEPLVVRKVISEQTSKTLREILEGAVSQGTGKNAYVQGYKIAGKTGTSETTVAGRYIASFAGFAPYDHPKVACIVIMDNPKGDSYSGGVVAAPAASEIIKQSLDYIGKSK